MLADPFTLPSALFGWFNMCTRWSALVFAWHIHAILRIWQSIDVFRALFGEIDVEPIVHHKRVGKNAERRL